MYLRVNIYKNPIIILLHLTTLKYMTVYITKYTLIIQRIFIRI